MTRVYMVPLVFVCLGLWAGCGWSLSLEVNAGQVAEIRVSEESEDVRFLLSFEVPDTLEDKSIDFACVSFEADCAGAEGGVSFQGFAVTRAWEAKTVSWDGPWDKAGGDWDKSLSAYWISEAGSDKTVELDVTEFAKRWVKEPSANFGIFVKVSGPFFGTFSPDKMHVPRLKILYSDK
jgi:hypothetical protein